MLKQLPNGLPTYMLMHLKTTDEKCQIVKINESLTDNILLTVDVKVTRIALGIPYDVILKVLPNDLEVWNEAMTPTHSVAWRTRKDKQIRSVTYIRTM